MNTDFADNKKRFDLLLSLRAPKGRGNPVVFSINIGIASSPRRKVGTPRNDSSGSKRFLFFHLFNQFSEDLRMIFR